MFGFVKKASLKAAAKNILENTANLVLALGVYEREFDAAIASGDSEKGAVIITASAEDANVRSAVSRLQSTLICSIPIKDISNDLLKPTLSGCYPDGMTATIIKKVIGEVLIKHGDNTPLANHYPLWDEVMVGIREWTGENWSSEGVSDPRFHDLWG